MEEQLCWGNPLLEKGGFIEKRWVNSFCIFTFFWFLCRKIQSVFELSDGSGLAVTVARYQTPAGIDIDKVNFFPPPFFLSFFSFFLNIFPQIGISPNKPLPEGVPMEKEGFCNCLEDPSSGLSTDSLFS